MPPLPRLTLIVATTPSLGIGLRGSLPWPPLKADLAFFARVTKRLPRNHDSPASDFAPTDQDGTLVPPSVNASLGAGNKLQTRAINAVLMGRKTWESIPPKFRPLKGRVNIIISRDLAYRHHLKSDSAILHADTAIVTAGSLEEGIRLYQEDYVGRMFVIGGASIYEQAMMMEACERVLWTRIREEYECDTWFPAGSLGAEGGPPGKRVWRKKARQDLEMWCGEDSIGGVKREGEIEFEVEMWESEKGKDQ